MDWGMRMLEPQTSIERMDDDEFSLLIAEPSYLTRGDLWFPERLEAKNRKRELQRLKEDTGRKTQEINKIREVSYETIKANNS
ncbi:hypothetical protein AAY55_00400 [Vibrio metoecus]|uniref:Uncharacterized protein n=2 Tax=Vibrionaceae TaxID=641 RepID=A0A0Q0M4D1_VIBMT|nr:hypothetical protein AAY55_00400 [Vibrio metoecus]